MQIFFTLATALLCDIWDTLTNTLNISFILAFLTRETDKNQR